MIFETPTCDICGYAAHGLKEKPGSSAYERALLGHQCSPEQPKDGGIECTLKAFQDLPENEIAALESKLREIARDCPESVHIANDMLAGLKDLWSEAAFEISDLRDKVAEPAPYESLEVTGRV